MATTQIHVLYPKRAMLGDSPVASQSLAVSSTAVAPAGYTAQTAVDGVDLVYFDVTTDAVRVRWDGTDPTASVGHLLPVNTNYIWDAQRFNSAKFIRVTTDAVIFSSALQC